MEIMVCFDRSGDNSAVLDKVRERGREPDAHIHLVTVLIDPSLLESLDPPKRDLETAQTALKMDGVLCEIQIAIGGSTVGECILNYAANHGVDEIIICIKKKSKIGKFLFGSIAQQVILEAHCPVLTVK